MKTVLLRISSIIDTTTEYIGRSVSWLSLLLMILICVDVFLRYTLNSTKTWVIELEWHLFAVLFLWGMSYTLLHDKHVRVDLFYEKLGQRPRRLVNILGIILLVVPWCLVVLDTSWDYFANSLSFGEGSPQPNGLPARYVIKSFIFSGFLLLTLQSISQLIKGIFGVPAHPQENKS